MEADILDRIQSMQLTTEEDETMVIRPMRRQEILEEYSLKSNREVPYYQND